MEKTATTSKRSRKPYAVHALLVLVGVLAVATAVHAAGRYTGLSFFPPDPRTLVPTSAAAYVPLSGDSRGTVEERRALRGLAATTGVRQATLAQVVSLLSSLGDRVGVARWTQDKIHRGSSPAMAFIAQIRISDEVALTGDSTSGRRAQALTKGTTWRLAYTHDGVDVYRFSIGGGGKAYGFLLAGDGVFASNPATANLMIEANGGP